MGRLNGIRATVQRVLRPGEALSSRIVNAGFWAFFMRAAMRGSQLIRVVILGRLLSPRDFGLMAMATITLGFLEVFSQTGFRQALVQSKEDVEDSLDTAWSIEIIRGLSVALLIFFGAPLIASFFEQPDAESIIQAMAVVALIAGFTNMAIVRFDRNLRFDLLFRFQMAQTLTEVVVAIGIAIVWPTVWALVIGAIAGAVARVTASFILAPRLPRFQIVRSLAGRMIRFGKWIYGSNVLSYLSSEADDILVGRMVGTGELGLYRMAYNLSQSVVSEIAMTVNQVMFPTFSLVQESRRRLGEMLTQSTHFVAFIALPVSMGFIVLGEEIVMVLLGDAWIGMTDALRILAVAGALRAIEAIPSIMFEGAGQPHLSTRYAALKLGVLLVVIFPLITNYGINGAALASAIASGAVMPPVIARVRRFTPEAFGPYLRAIAWPLANTMLMGLVMFATLQVGPQDSDLLALLLASFTGGATYVLAIAVGTKYLGYREPRAILARLASSDDSQAPQANP